MLKSWFTKFLCLIFEYNLKTTKKMELTLELLRSEIKDCERKLNLPAEIQRRNYDAKMLKSIENRMNSYKAELKQLNNLLNLK